MPLYGCFLDGSGERTLSGEFMKVGVYVDGLNLYYGGRSHFRRAARGWRWLDLRQLSERLLARRSDWLKQGALL